MVNKLSLAVTSAVMGSFQFGWNTGVINNPQKIISIFINETLYNRGFAASDLPSKVDLIWSFIVSSFAFSGMFGGLLAGWSADYFGRTKAILMVNIFVLLGALCMGISKVLSTFELLIIGRIITGFASGLYTGLVPLYVSEISPIHLRGALGVINQVLIVSSILLSQILGLMELLGSETTWPYLLSLCIIPSVIQIATMPFCPESPRYLLIQKGNEQAAYESLSALRGTSAVEEELRVMRDEAVASVTESSVSVWRVLSQPLYRRAILVGVVLHLSQQFSGINNIFYYSSRLFEAVGVSAQASQYATLGVGAVLVVVTIASVPLMDRAGRRDLHLVGLTGILVCSVLFTITFALQGLVPWFSYVSILSAMVFVLFFAIGPGSIPWLIIAEMFSQGPRSTAVSIGVAVNWTANFVVGLIFLPLLKALDRLIFLPFAVLTLLFLVYLWFAMVETKGRSVQEVTQLLHHGRSPLEASTDSKELENRTQAMETPHVNNNYGSYQATE